MAVHEAVQLLLEVVGIESFQWTEMRKRVLRLRIYNLTYL